MIVDIIIYANVYLITSNKHFPSSIAQLSPPHFLKIQKASVFGQKTSKKGLRTTEKHYNNPTKHKLF